MSGAEILRELPRGWGYQPVFKVWQQQLVRRTPSTSGVENTSIYAHASNTWNCVSRDVTDVPQGREEDGNVLPQ